MLQEMNRRKLSLGIKSRGYNNISNLSRQKSDVTPKIETRKFDVKNFDFGDKIYRSKGQKKASVALPSIDQKIDENWSEFDLVPSSTSDSSTSKAKAILGPSAAQKPINTPKPVLHAEDTKDVYDDGSDVPNDHQYSKEWENMVQKKANELEGIMKTKE